jgi:hypothetical protein
MARRYCSDTIAMVCDSGPTARFLPSAFNLYEQEYKMKFWPLRMLVTPPLALLWSPHMHKDLGPQLDSFPNGFPILSIRGWKDKLIPPQDIDLVFEPHKQLDWTKLSLPEAEHLKGLKDFPSDYKPAVEKFLTRVATRTPNFKST